jgi:hypothetical protein
MVYKPTPLPPYRGEHAPMRACPMPYAETEQCRHARKVALNIRYGEEAARMFYSECERKVWFEYEPKKTYYEPSPLEMSKPHYQRLCQALGGIVVFVDTGMETIEGQVSETGWIRGAENCAWRNEAVYHPVHGPTGTKFYGGYPIVYPVRLDSLK